MSQADLVVANDTGANVRGDINAQLQALGSLMAGTTAPTTTYAGMFWLDTTLHVLKRRNEANNAWIIVAKFDETNGLSSPYAWNAVLDEAFETLASATTTNLATPVSRNVSITGTTTITGFGTVKAGSIRHLRFEGALVLTHNATSLILPGGANITTAANDTADFLSLGSGNWLCLNYKKQSGAAVSSATEKLVQRIIPADITAQSTITNTIPNDDTAPTSGEGTQMFSQAITASDAANKIRIVATFNGAGDANGQAVISLYKDGTNVRSVVLQVQSTNINSGALIWEAAAGDTSAHTFTLRAGGVAGQVASFYPNGNSGGRKFGGALAWTMELAEFKP